LKNGGGMDKFADNLNLQTEVCQILSKTKK